MITQELLKELLYYDAVSGRFTWIKSNRLFLGTVAGCKDTNGYIQIRVKGIKYPAHKLAILYTSGVYPEYVDHKNLCITDNSWKNLRVCDKFQNAQNKAVSYNNMLGIKGITKDSHGYRARVIAYGKKKSKRFKFSTNALEQAITWIQETRKELHGEYTNHG